MKFFNCNKCDQPVFFENTLCVKCNHTLGYLPDLATVRALSSVEGDTWEIAGQQSPGQLYRMCENYSKAGVCNWMIPAHQPDPLCLACRLNRTIPDLSQPHNVACWGRLEAAKRRLVYSLLALGLPVKNKQDEPERGLAFSFLADSDPDFVDSPRVITGHDEGLITINIAEADDAFRVKMRLDMDERYRTVLGHFRHEVGHYYWQILIRDSTRIDAFRRLFGDERQDYDSALKQYYDNKAPDNWQDNYISAYASSHPWEDWAETWAHYLHIVDMLETAQAFDLAVEGSSLQKLAISEQLDATRQAGESFERLLAEWLPLTFAFNSINRSMGLDDVYPFVLSESATNKLHFIHQTIKSKMPGVTTSAK